jgi:hypothetical protein
LMSSDPRIHFIDPLFGHGNITSRLALRWSRRRGYERPRVPWNPSARIRGEIAAKTQMLNTK